MDQQFLPLDPHDVVVAVARIYHVQAAALISHDRRSPLDAARRVAYRLVYDECGLSWASTARFFDRPGGGWLSATAAKADPAVLEAARLQLRGNGQATLL